MHSILTVHRLVSWHCWHRPNLLSLWISDWNTHNCAWCLSLFFPIDANRNSIVSSLVFTLVCYLLHAGRNCPNTDRQIQGHEEIEEAKIVWFNHMSQLRAGGAKEGDTPASNPSLFQMFQKERMMCLLSGITVCFNQNGQSPPEVLWPLSNSWKPPLQWEDVIYYRHPQMYKLLSASTRSYKILTRYSTCYSAVVTYVWMLSPFYA